MVYKFTRSGQIWINMVRFYKYIRKNWKCVEEKYGWYEVKAQKATIGLREADRQAGNDWKAECEREEWQDTISTIKNMVSCEKREAETKILCLKKIQWF